MVGNFRTFIKDLYFCLFCFIIIKVLIINQFKMMFLQISLIDIAVIESMKAKGGWIKFLLNIISWTFLLKSGLGLIFHWNAQLLTFFNLMLSSFADTLKSWTTSDKLAHNSLINVTNESRSTFCFLLLKKSDVKGSHQICHFATLCAKLC